VCIGPAQEEFNRSVALLHFFYYPAAVKAFTHVTEIDPGRYAGMFAENEVDLDTLRVLT
jgi:hypothetical protein